MAGLVMRSCAFNSRLTEASKTKNFFSSVKRTASSRGELRNLQRQIDDLPANVIRNAIPDATRSSDGRSAPQARQPDSDRTIGKRSRVGCHQLNNCGLL